MKTAPRKPLWTTALAAAVTVGVTVGLSGCVVVPAHHHRYAYPDAGLVVPVAPPPPRVEMIGVAPFVGAVWIPGRWLWQDHWVWRGGHWRRPPHAGAHWHRGRWERHRAHEWRWHSGHWR